MTQPQFDLEQAAASLAERDYMVVIRQARIAYDEPSTTIPPEATIPIENKMAELTNHNKRALLNG